MLSCFAALALVCLVLPEESQWAGNSIRTPLLSDVLELEEQEQKQEQKQELEQKEDSIESIELADTLENIAVALDNPIDSSQLLVQLTDSSTAIVSAIPEQEQFDTTDTRIYLKTFYNSLKDANSQAVRVVHYGDSQIEEDRITLQLRRALQYQYGGGGVGLLPLHQTIPTRTIWQSITINGKPQQINQGPKRHLVYGPRTMRRSNSRYGPMGQVALMNNTLVDGSEDIVMQVNGGGRKKNSESYFNRIRIVQSGDIDVSINRAVSHEGNLFFLPDSTTSATIHLQGKGEVYGISLENDKGVMVDNIPMRGSSGSVFTGIAPNELQNYYKQTNTRLIILQFGGNTIPYTNTKQQVASYINQLQTQIQYIKYLAPESSILFIGPSDMCERRDGKLQTYKMIPVMDRALLKMAKEEKIAYFSFYQHMGGKDSMLEWKEKGWAGGDYVHFTPRGADKAGELLTNWLMKQ